MDLTDLHTELRTLRGDLQAELHALRGDLQAELRTLRGTLQTTESRLSVLYGKIEKVTPTDRSQTPINFGRITSVAARKPLVLEELRQASAVTKKAFFAALAYLTALDSAALEDKLYYLCRLAQGCDYATTAEGLRKLGLAYAPQDLATLRQHLGGLEQAFMVEALVLANLGGLASREVLGALTTVADSLELDDEDVHNSGFIAKAVLRSGKRFSTLDEVAQWERLNSLQVGDIFTFGNYPQDANGAFAPIEWQVLQRDDDGLLAIAKYALDCKPYNEGLCDITWAQCTLRRWLNNEFVNKTFDSTERKQIMTAHLNNPNSKFDSSVAGGADTDDQVFLLSHDEAEKLLVDTEKRECLATEYAKKNNAYTTDNGICAWWLRSPGGEAIYAAGVNRGGFISDYYVNGIGATVRPVVKIAI